MIVESPTKCKTIGKYLGNDFQVISSFGHIRSLPSKKGSVLPEENFNMIYEANENSQKHIDNLLKAVKTTDTIYLATDPDREGEAISWHILETLRIKKAIKKSTIVHRVSFNEITKSAVLKSIENPRPIDMDLVQAQQTRQALDYLVGFTLSPLLWKKLPGSRSAGRVQSVALRMICDRENEIKKFTSEEYWKITATFHTEKLLQAYLSHLDGKKLEKLSINNEKQAHKIVEGLVGKQYKIIKIEKKEIKRYPSPPFITSTLQQDAANKLGFSTKMTMMVAQKLYEGVKIDKEVIGLITYMRTDGVYVNENFIADTRSAITQLFGEKYLPKSAKKYISKIKNAQEAHEAIRPTNIEITPEIAAKYLNKEQLSLYTLIWNRMIASQMNHAILNQVAIILESLDQYATFRSSGSTIKFDGFYKLYRNNTEEDEGKLLPNLTEGEIYDIDKVLPTQHFTQPPPRFTEATLVKKMEELGIGRPSTYTNIISVLQDRNYVALENKKFIPAARGQFVTAFLLSFFTLYVEYNFTANLEEDLDKISNNDANWKEVLNSFWQPFISNVQNVEQYKIIDILAEIDKMLESYIFPKDKDGNVNRKCSKCNDGKLNLNIGKFGPFTGCSNYPECNYRSSIFDDKDDDTGDYPIAIGTHPESDDEVSLKKGPYGVYLQCGDKKSTIPKGLESDNIQLDLAIKLLNMPYSIGTNSENNLEVKVGVGRYGPYLLHNKKYTSINTDQLLNIKLTEALQVINAKNKNKILGDFNNIEVQLCKGRYGLYISYDGQNIALPKNMKSNKDITYDEAVNIITTKKNGDK